MNKSNIHKRMRDTWWIDDPTNQRACEKKYYDSLYKEMRHKKKTKRGNNKKADHKHLYEQILLTDCHKDGFERTMIAPYCTVCGKYDKYVSFHMPLLPGQKIPDDLPHYRLINGKLQPIK